MESLDQQIQACLEGDIDAFAGVVDAHESDVRAVIASMCPDSGLVPDLIQEVFLIVFRKLDSYQSGTNFRAWIKAIARNVAQNERRRWYRRQDMQLKYQAEAQTEHQIAENIDQFVESLPEETLESLRECVGGLQGKTRALVDGYYYEGCSIKQVAGILDVSASAAKVALHRARKAVGDCLQRKGRPS